MGLSLRGSTSGAIDINPPAVAGDNAITLPASNGSANQFFKNSGTAGIVTYSSMVEKSDKIGIGTDNPIYKLDVLGTNVLANIKSTNNNYVLQFAGNNCPYDVYVGSDNANNFLLANENNDGTFSERLRVLSGGEVGIGTDNPTSLLHMSGSAPRITLTDTAGTDDIAKIFSSSGALYFQQRDGSDHGEIIFRTENNSTATERLRIQSNGGISFNGDTATANALDDYEEGTITTWRLIKGDATNTNGSNHAQTEVQYTKIGRCVYISGHIRTDSTQTGKTGNLLLVSTADGSTAATLPFVPNHRGGLPIVHTRSCSTSDTTYGLCVGFNEGSSTVYVYANDTTGDYVIDSNTLDTNTQTNLVITFNGHYFTDS